MDDETRLVFFVSSFSREKKINKKELVVTSFSNRRRITISKIFEIKKFFLSMELRRMIRGTFSSDELRDAANRMEVTSVQNSVDNVARLGWYVTLTLRP